MAMSKVWFVCSKCGKRPPEVMDFHVGDQGVVCVLCEPPMPDKYKARKSMDKDTAELLRQATIRKDKLISEQRFDEAGKIRDLINGLNKAEELRVLLGINKIMQPPTLFSIVSPTGELVKSEDADGCLWNYVVDSLDEAEKQLRVLNDPSECGVYSKYRIVQFIPEPPETSGEPGKSKFFIEEERRHNETKELLAKAEAEAAHWHNEFDTLAKSILIKGV